MDKVYKMATGGKIQYKSEETYEYICTSCAEDHFIKEALKYCLDCQRYCCKDCLVSHRRIPVTKGHSFVDIAAVKPQGLTRSLPAFPTKQCSKHAGKIMNMYCGYHNDVGCYVCAKEDHRCNKMISVFDNIDELYNKTDITKTTSDISRMLHEINRRRRGADVNLQRLRDSKEAAIKAAKDFRLEIEKRIKELEEASINEINNEYEIMEAQLLDEKKIYEDYTEDLKKLKQQLSQASVNVAQQFVCSKLAQKNIKTIEASEIYSAGTFHPAEVIFRPIEDLKTRFERMTSLGVTTSKLPRQSKLHKIEKICNINVKLRDDRKECCIFGSCILNDTVLFTDFYNSKLKWYEISSSSLLNYCKAPDGPQGICIVDNTHVAVACQNVVQFVTINFNRLSLSRLFKMNHQSFGIAFNNNKLYITDERKSLYMYDMVGNLLKTVTKDDNGQNLFGYSRHITFSDYYDRVYVADAEKGLVCFNKKLDHIKTIKHFDVEPTGVCVDGSGNIIIANQGLQSIVQCDKDGHKMGIIVNTAESEVCPWSVCIHPRLNRMYVCSGSSKVKIYQLY